MLWFIVWTVLVVGALLGGVLLGRRLYRSAQELLHELGRASEVLAAAADRAGAPVDAPGAPVGVDLHRLLDADAAQARRAEVAAARAGRRAARADRHEAAYRRWRSLSR